MKKLSESIWSDMQDRSSGETVRQEDIITTNEVLRAKIGELYKEQGEGETLDVSSLTNAIQCDDFSNIFKGYKKVKHIIGLENWDVSKVTNMKGMFQDCYKFNANLSNWDVSSVENMKRMFQNCYNFNSDLSKWDVSEVTDIHSMFYNCKNFNSDLSKWNVSSVRYMTSMFDHCTNFNCDLSKWNVSSVKYAENIFRGCRSLKQLPSWYFRLLEIS